MSSGRNDEGLGFRPEGWTEEEAQRAQEAESAQEPIVREFDNPPPHELCAVLTLVGGLFTVLILLFPAFRWVPLPGGAVIPMAWLVMVVLFMAVGWSIAGLFEPAPTRRIRQCLLLLCINGISGVGALLAYIEPNFLP